MCLEGECRVVEASLVILISRMRRLLGTRFPILHLTYLEFTCGSTRLRSGHCTCLAYACGASVMFIGFPVTIEAEE